MSETPMTSPNPNENPNENIGFSDNGPTEEPKKRRGRQPGSVSSKAQGDTLKRIESGISGMLQGAGALMLAAGGKVALDGQVILLHEPRLTQSVVELCRQDKRAREFLLSLTTGSAYANVVIACVPIIIAILANHNLLPPIFGIAPQAPVATPNGQVYNVADFAN